MKKEHCNDMIKWLRANTQQIPVKMNFVENYGKCFYGMERTSKKKVTKNSKVLIYNAYYSNILAYRVYNHTMRQSTRGAFCIPE